jgi:hypothetical protein
MKGSKIRRTNYKADSMGSERKVLFDYLLFSNCENVGVTVLDCRKEHPTIHPRNKVKDQIFVTVHRIMITECSSIHASHRRRALPC